ncbi:unnamed protein product [Gongylonema pulchrum]|uniref:Uncharacterized protein n=1 Tax=Gongylonema pulchrum TaxID=637853 RepID=A0A3P6QPB1_9BILA|nr:unnamed protein product [Gongylonema pulchrum]
MKKDENEQAGTVARAFAQKNIVQQVGVDSLKNLQRTTTRPQTALQIAVII